MKLFTNGHNIAFEGTVSEIFYLGPSFDFI